MTSELRVDRIVPVDGVPTGGGGGIVQTTVGRLTSHFADSTNQSYMASNLITSITPRFSNSKFFVQMNGGRIKARNAAGMNVKMYVSLNGGSYAPAYSGNRADTFYYSSSGEIQVPHSFTDLYTPSVAITSTIAFQPYWRSFNGGEFSFNISDSNSYGEVVMTVMEVSV